MQWQLAWLIVGALGCSVDPTERLCEDIEAKDRYTRLAAIQDMRTVANRATLEALADAFADDPTTREETAVTLVLRGRAWHRAHPHPGGMERNGVIVQMGDVAARQDLEPAIRAKAVWVLAEVGDRSARAAIEGAYVGDSTVVAEEQAIALDKLGFTEKAHGFECLADGRTVRDYDPRERGHMEAGDGH